MATPPPMFKEAKNGTLARETLGTIGLKFSMHTQLNSVTWAGSHLATPLLWVCKATTKIAKNCQKWYFRKMLGPKELDS